VGIQGGRRAKRKEKGKIKIKELFKNVEKIKK